VQSSTAQRIGAGSPTGEDVTTQIATNSTAIRNLAGRLESLGYAGDDVLEVAEKLAMNLLSDGYRPVERVPDLRPTRVATDEERRAALSPIYGAIDAARRKSTTVTKEDV